MVKQIRNKVHYLTVAVILGLTACEQPLQYTATEDDYKVYLGYDTEDSTKTDNEKFAAYFDFSGVYIAYEDSATNLTFNGLTQKITGSISKYDIYSLANDSIIKLSDAGLNSGQLFAKLKDSNQQGKLFAPIEKSLKQIIAEDRSAVLVTDFEEYSKEKIIYRQAYATEYFEEWLKRGKSITFFVTDYKEVSTSKSKKKNEQLQGLSKHLYYAVFDDNDEKLLSEVLAGLEGCPVNYKTFRLSNTNYTISTKYPTNQGGTYHDANGDDIVTSSMETPDGHININGCNAEVYTFCQPWTDIAKNAKALREPGVTPKFEHLLSGVFIDLSKFDSYTINSLDVNVADITDDYDRFLGRRVAEKYPATKSEIEGETIVEIPKESKVYYNEDGTIISYYTERGKITNVDGLLKFAQLHFDDTFKSSEGSATELAVDLSTPPNIPSPDVRVLKVDVQISKATPNLGMAQPGEKIYDLFYWEGNDCLYMSVKNVLQHCNPEGRIVYTYIIRQL